MDKEMVQKLVENGTATLQSLAQAAKTTGEHLYGILVRQQMVDGIASIIAWTCYLISMFFIGKFIVGFTSKKHKKYENGEIWLYAFVIYILVLFFGFALFSSLQGSLEQILNPEYFAIKFLLEAVKK
jgi:hypothetical protein